MIRGLRTNWREGRSQVRRAERVGRAEVGRHTYFDFDTKVLMYDGDETRLLIGSYTSIAKGVSILLGGNHNIESITTFPLRRRLGLAPQSSDRQPWSAGDVTIGSDVWIAYGATVLSGVTIGHGAVVTAGSVVVKDVAPYSVVGGVPARHIRYRFSSEEIHRLLELEWWTWDDQRVRGAMELLTGSDVVALALYHTGHAR